MTIGNDLLFVTHGNDLEYLNIILNIYEIEKERYRNIIFLDLSDILSQQDTFSRSILRFSLIESPEKIIFQNLEKLGHKVIRVKFSNSDLSIEKVPIQSLLQIEESVRSALVSRSGQEKPEESRWIRRKRIKYLNEAILTFNFVLEYLTSNKEIQTIIVPNGRFPVQRGAIEAAKVAKVEWKSYERGSYEGMLMPWYSCVTRYSKCSNYWYASYPATSRIRKQQEILNLDLTDEEVRANRVKLWFSLRRESIIHNRFSERWKQDFHIENQQKSAVIFSSSNDEFAELGPEWKESEWSDQWEAFRFIIPLLINLNFMVILRLHPNLINKLKIEQIRTRELALKLKKDNPNLVIIEPASSVNTYELLKSAEIIFVWNSTVGLEASQMGIKTIVLEAADYDMIADVRRWRSSRDVDFESLKNWKINIEGSLKYVAGIHKLDHEAWPLLEKYGLDVKLYAKGLALFSNRWAMRGNNRVINLLSIVLPQSLYLRLRKFYRNIRFSNCQKIWIN